MHTLRLCATVTLTTTVLALTAAAAAPAATPRLVGTVGPGFTITLTQNGKKVTSLKAGTYTLVVRDKASTHNFALDGPNGYEKDFTSVSLVGTKTFTVALKKGKYKYYCAPHETTMSGRFSVT